jgi:hypothetical protein
MTLQRTELAMQPKMKYAGWVHHYLKRMMMLQDVDAAAFEKFVTGNSYPRVSIDLLALPFESSLNEFLVRKQAIANEETTFQPSPRLE